MDETANNKTLMCQLRDLTRSKTWYDYIRDHYHVNANHKNRSDIQLIDRLLDKSEKGEVKPASSNFYPNKNFEEFIGYMFDDGAIEINDWLNTPDKDRPNMISIQVVSENEPIGSGFKIDPKSNTLKEYITNSCTFVLRHTTVKDSKLAMPFYIVSAYPNILVDVEDGFIKETHRDIESIIKQTDVYKGADTTYKAYLTYLLSDRPDKLKIFPYYNAYNDDHCLKITVCVDNKDYKVSMLAGTPPTVRGWNSPIRNIDDLLDIMANAKIPERIEDELALMRRQVNTLHELNELWSLVDETNQMPLFDLKYTSPQLDVVKNPQPCSSIDKSIANELDDEILWELEDFVAKLEYPDDGYDEQTFS